MAGKHKFTVEEVKEALIASNGFMSTAAKRLKCNLSTIVNYINEFPEIKQTVYDIRHERDDFVESQLMKAIKNGELTAIIFYLKTQARHRGYNEREDAKSKIKPLFMPDNERDVDYLQDNYDN